MLPMRRLTCMVASAFAEVAGSGTRRMRSSASSLEWGAAPSSFFPHCEPVVPRRSLERTPDIRPL